MGGCAKAVRTREEEEGWSGRQQRLCSAELVTTTMATVFAHCRGKERQGGVSEHGDE
jgi:hypothetical protein